MGHKSQYQVRSKQKEKRRKARGKLIKSGANLADYYYGKYYIKIG